MKRALALLLALLLVIPMAACQTGNPSAADPTEAPAPTATQEPQDVQNAAEGIISDKEYLKVYKTSFSSSYSSFNYFSTAYSTVRSSFPTVSTALSSRISMAYMFPPSRRTGKPTRIRPFGRLKSERA